MIDRRVGRSLDEVFIWRRVGQFSAVHCSASIASLELSRRSIRICCSTSKNSRCVPWTAPGRRHKCRRARRRDCLMSQSACWPGRSSSSGHAREEEPTPLTTKLEQMLTQLWFFPGASAAWFQLTVTLTRVRAREENAPACKAGAGVDASKGGVSPFYNASGGIGSQRERGRLR